jgi:para-aminobenzoate synthetase component 1
MARDPRSIRTYPLGPIPIDRLLRGVGRLDRPALLLSGPAPADAGRWSILAAEPHAEFRALGTRWSADRIGPGGAPIAEHAGADDPLAAFARWLAAAGLDTPDGPEADALADAIPCPFRGGAIGFLGYDLAPRIERLPRRTARDSILPDILFGLHDTAVVVDHAAGVATLLSADGRGEGEAARSRRVDRWRRVLDDPPPAPPPGRLGGPIASNLSPAGYRDAVRRALEYIAAGDIFQVNLSQRFAAPGAFDPLDLFLRLRYVSPAPFAAMLSRPGWSVVSASPEWFYQTRGDAIVTRPIKGTRPRGDTPEADARLAEELRQSVKDRAELTMIVDLERNDLGRVCRYGSVRVTEALGVESFAQVHHLVATVEGRLRAGCGPVDVVRAMSPGGSITGAPKIRAMEIIDELEPNRRGLYTGAIGYYSPGASGFNIAIRTLLLEGDRATFGVGGGIVADSEPDREFEETLHKGRGLRAVLEGEGA